jgi:hypothetical protein
MTRPAYIVTSSWRDKPSAYALKKGYDDGREYSRQWTVTPAEFFCVHCGKRDTYTCNADIFCGGCGAHFTIEGGGSNDICAALLSLTTGVDTLSGDSTPRRISISPVKPDGST